MCVREILLVKPWIGIAGYCSFHPISLGYLKALDEELASLYRGQFRNSGTLSFGGRRYSDQGIEEEFVFI